MSANQYPKFQVTILRSGRRSGVLFEKRTVLDGPSKGAYCYFDNGILPEDVPALCGHACYEIRSNGENRWVMAELVAFGESVVPNEGCGLTRHLQNERFGSAKSEFRASLRHFIKRLPPSLNEFFGNYEGFCNRVLAPLEGGEKIIGRASFRVCHPDDLAPVRTVRILQKGEDVLRINDGPQPGWVSKAGPTRADFLAGRVYPRTPFLQQLHRAVFEHPFFVLVGDAATGKTVLVRNLIYDLYQDGRRSLYWLSDTDFDVSSLAAEINSFSGLIVIEDIHLDTAKYQRLYSRLVPRADRHVLFTARRTFRANQDRHLQLLDQLPSTLPLHVNRFTKKVKHRAAGSSPRGPSNAENDALPVAWSYLEEADQILEHWARHRYQLELPEQDREAIKQVAGKNLWLLSYAVQGYADSHGCEPPTQWVVAGVREDLDDLCRKHSEFPELLVALAPLSMHELFTAESFLLHELAFQASTLDQLVAMGEITRRWGPHGDAFYGLPHSALANAYWLHGDRYRKRRGLISCTDFVYRYAMAGASNSWRAITEAWDGARSDLLARLAAANRLLPVLKSAFDHHQYCEVLGAVGPEVYASEQGRRRIASMIADHLLKLDDVRDLSRAFFWLGASHCRWCPVHEAFAAAVVPQHLANLINRSGSAFSCVMLFDKLAAASPEVARAVWSEIDKQVFLTRIMQDSPGRCADNLIQLSKSLRGAGLDLKGLITEEHLRERLRNCSTLLDMLIVLYGVYAVDTEIRAAEWGINDVAAYATQYAHPREIHTAIDEFFSRRLYLGLLLQMCRRINIDVLEQRIHGLDDADEWSHVVKSIRTLIAPDMTTRCSQPRQRRRVRRGTD